MKILRKIERLYHRLNLGKSHYNQMKQDWGKSIDCHLQQIYENSNLIRENRIYGISGVLESSFRKYLSEHLPDVCKEAGKFCPEKVEELEEKVKEVKGKLFN